MDGEKEKLGPCPIARGLDRIGDRWSMLVLRDIDRGFTRYEQLRTSLGIAPNILARRLAALTDAGLLDRRRYSARPPRDEYLLTDAGRDFIPVLAVIGAWGAKHHGEGGVSRLIDEESGHVVQPLVIDSTNGAPIGTRRLTIEQP